MMPQRLLLLTCLVIGGALIALAQPNPQEMIWQAGQTAVRQGDWVEAATLWQSILAQKTWALRQSREEVTLLLLQAKRQVRCEAQARTLALDLLAAHPADTWTVRALVHLTAIDADVGQEAVLDRTLCYALDDPVRPPAIISQYLAEVIKLDRPRPVWEALTRYRAAHPTHPQYLQLRLAEAQLAAAAGEHAAALTAARQLLADAAGTPVETSVAVLVATEEAALGHDTRAGDVLWGVAPFYPKETANAVAALGYYRQAGDLPKTAEVATTLTKTSLPLQAIETLYWLGQVAVAQGDTEHAQQWLGALIAAAPEHPRSAKARKLLRSMGQPATGK